MQNTSFFLKNYETPKLYETRKSVLTESKTVFGSIEAGQLLKEDIIP